MDKGPQDVVVSFPNPANIWLRYYHKLKPDELDTNILLKFGRFLFGKSHPLYKTTMMLLNNKDEANDPIYNPFEPDPLVKLTKWSSFMVTRLVRLTGELGLVKGDKERKRKTMEALSKAVGDYKANIINKIAYVYTRDIKDVEFQSKVKRFKRDWSYHTNIELKGVETEEEMDNYIKDYGRKLNYYFRKLDRAFDKFFEEE